MFKGLLMLLVVGAVYVYLLRNRKMKFEVEFELEPEGSKDAGETAAVEKDD